MDVDAADPKKPTVVVALATQMDCQLLADVIERQCRFQVAAYPINSTSALCAIQQIHPDLVLISPCLEDGTRSGLQVAQSVHASGANSRIVMLIGSGDREIVLESFRCGARGVLSVNDSTQDLCKCMVAVLRGDIWVSSTHLTYLVEAFAETRASVLLDLRNRRALTQCEDEILQCLAAGLTNRQIGSRLKVPENQIRKHISGMLQKTGVSSRAELALHAPPEWLGGIENKGSNVPEQEVGS